MEKPIYRTYKTFIFFRPDLEKDVVLNILKKYYNLLNIKNIEFCFKYLGTKVLAYPIKEFSTATQVQVIFEGNGSLINEITKQLSLNENVIRYITIKK